ncbi:hypothetical protein [Microbacterium sp. gxy059]|uniref:hypothetical protein n=1 Tax=Microbacterium sp. gxy059 TaxID=2957199 RepID=UPI003D99384F
MAGKTAVTRGAIALAAAAVLLAAPGCAATPDETQAVFARTSVDVVIPSGEPFSTGLAFVAPKSDPIWTDVSQVAFVDAGGEERVLGGDVADLVEEGSGGGDPRVGTLRLEVDGGEELAVSQVRLIIGEETATFPVGSVTVERADDAPAWTAVGWPGAMSSCGPVEADLDGLGDRELIEVRADAPGLTIANARLDAAGGATRLSFDMECDDAQVDFLVVTPRLVTEGDDGIREEALPPVSVGQIDIDDADVERIRARGAD